jgi:hypothetical protein
MIKTLTMYNNKTHWGGTQILGLTPKCLVVVPLLYSKSARIISQSEIVKSLNIHALEVPCNEFLGVKS